MDSLTHATILEKLQWRYATKKFDPTKKISAADWQILEQALVLTPSSYGLQPWKFFVVDSPELKAQLPPVSWGQMQPQDCSHMLVLAIKKNLGEEEIDRYLARISEVRNTPVAGLAGFKKMMMSSLVPPKGFDINDWATRQVYIALGQFMTTAAMMGIDTCPMEGLDPAKYDEILGISQRGYQTVVACPAGYRSADDKYASVPKVRFKASDVIEHL